MPFFKVFTQRNQLTALLGLCGFVAYSGLVFYKLSRPEDGSLICHKNMELISLLIMFEVSKYVVTSVTSDVLHSNWLAAYSTKRLFSLIKEH